MPRPIQLTSPVPSTLLNGFGGAANVNLLAAGLNPTPLTPFSFGAAQIASTSTPVVIGATLSNKVDINPNDPYTTIVVQQPTGPVALNRGLVITCAANLVGETITLRGRDASHQPLQETIAGAAAATPMPSVNKYAYLDYFACTLATASTDFTLAVGLTFTTCPIRLDYFYPNSSYSISGDVLGTGATYTVYGTIQKTTLFTSQGIPYTNPNIVWRAIDATLTGATTDIIYSTANLRTAVYLDCTLTDATSALSLTVVQQGVR